MVEKMVKSNSTMAKFSHAFSLQNPNTHLPRKWNSWVPISCSSINHTNFTKKNPKSFVRKQNPQILGLWPKISRNQGSQFLVQAMVLAAGFDAWKAKGEVENSMEKSAPSPVLWSQEPNPKSMVKTYPKPTGFGGKFYALILSILCLNSWGNLSVLLLFDVWA